MSGPSWTPGTTPGGSTTSNVGPVVCFRADGAWFLWRSPIVFRIRCMRPTTPSMGRRKSSGRAPAIEHHQDDPVAGAAQDQRATGGSHDHAGRSVPRHQSDGASDLAHPSDREPRQRVDVLALGLDLFLAHRQGRVRALGLAVGGLAQDLVAIAHGNRHAVFGRQQNRADAGNPRQAIEYVDHQRLSTSRSSTPANSRRKALSRSLGERVVVHMAAALVSPGETSSVPKSPSRRSSVG